MKLSIIIPFQNGISYLKDCLESILTQGLDENEYEVILVLDHTQEKYEEFILSWQKRLTLKVKELSDKTGVAAARNLGLCTASGLYLYFLDSDDYLSPDVLVRMIDEFKDPQIKLVTGNKVRSWYGRESYLKMREQKEELTQGNVAATEEETPYKVYGTASVLHLMIHNSLVKGIEFDESLIYYSDLPFAAEVFSLVSFAILLPEVIYVQRNHNDSIQLPSLEQKKDDRKHPEFLLSYQKAVLRSSEETKTFLTTHLLAYVIKQLCVGKHPEGLNRKIADWEPYAVAVSEIKEVGLSDYSGLQKKVLQCFMKKNCKKAVRTAKRFLFFKKKNGVFGSKMQWIWAIYKHIFCRLPIKKEVVLFESFLGKSYADSCKYIYQYMQEQGYPYRYVWVIADKDVLIPGNALCVTPLSLRYFYWIARSHFWVNNMRQPVWYDKRPGSVFLETWHGTPLKRLVFDMEEVHSASPEYKMQFYKQSRVWDYLISDNSFSTEVFQSAFLFPRDKILEYGYPRNDLLYSENQEEKIRQIKDSLGLPLHKKIVLYAPTWRDDEYYAKGQYKFQVHLDLDRFKQQHGENYILMLRMHYFIADQLNLSEADYEFIRDVSRYDDIGELYLISDLCITDYSSVFFDFANLGRPILFYVYDFEKYRDVLRGFYIDMETDLPGPLLFTNDELMEAIQTIDQVSREYEKKYHLFRERFCSLDDGHAAERIVKKVFGEAE